MTYKNKILLLKTKLEKGIQGILLMGCVRDVRSYYALCLLDMKLN